MHYAIYEVATGKIRQVGECPDRDIDLQAPMDAALDLYRGKIDPDAEMIDPATRQPVPRPAEAPTKAAVDAERQRRLDAGISVTVGGVTIPTQASDKSLLLITGLGADASAQSNAGNGSQPMSIPFRDANNVAHALTWQQMQMFAQAVRAAVSEIYAKSWALKAMRPIPADYTADSYWM